MRVCRCDRRDRRIALNLANLRSRKAVSRVRNRKVRIILPDSAVGDPGRDHRGRRRTEGRVSLTDHGRDRSRNQGLSRQVRNTLACLGSASPSNGCEGESSNNNHISHDTLHFDRMAPTPPWGRSDLIRY